MRYLLQHPNETRPSLLVEVLDSVDSTVLDRVRAAMQSVGCANALVFSPQHVHLLRDTFRDMTPASIQEEDVQIMSEQLLGRDGDLSDRVRRWLEAMSTNWTEVLPREQWAAPLLYDVVPATSGSIIQRVESDAA